MNYMKEKRNKKIKFRKNFFPTLTITFFLWLCTFGIIYFVEPSVFGIVPFIFVLVFFSLLFSFSTILANTRRGLIISFSLVLFLILRYLGIGNILNAILIIFLAITAELYFIKQA